MIALVLPYPPSANRLWRSVNGRSIKSAEYRSWMASAMGAACVGLRGLSTTRIAGPFTVTLTATRPDRRRRDLDNLIKPTLDALAASAVIADDSDAVSILARWAPDAPNPKAGVSVIVEAV